MRYGCALGRVHWRLRRDAGAEYGSLRKLDHHHSKLCVAAVSACRRRVVTPISRESLWHTCLFRCGGPSGTGESLPASDSRSSNLPDLICDRSCVVVSSATLRRRLARSLLPDGVWWDCIRAGRSCDTSDVHRNGRNDSACRCGRCEGRGDRARPYSVGQFQSAPAYVEPGNRYRSQTDLD